MRMEIYLVTLVLVAAVAVSAFAAYATATGNAAAENPSSVCALGEAAQDIQDPCTAGENCGLPTCEALEGRSCGCGNACQPE
jgi:hypothetical protein